MITLWVLIQAPVLVLAVRLYCTVPTVLSVSYTHLDVYKRQGRDCGVGIYCDDYALGANTSSCARAGR